MRKSKQTWQWVPSEWVSWHSVVLPKGRGWREALPFMVEDQLAVSVESVMVLPTPQDVDGVRWVAVVDKSVVSTWSSQPTMSQASGWCPDVLALPWSSEEGVTAVIEGDRVRLRWGLWQGAAGSLMTMSLLLDRLIQQGCHSIRLYAESIPPTWQAWPVDCLPLDQWSMVSPHFNVRTEQCGRLSGYWASDRRWHLPMFLLLGVLTMGWIQLTAEAWQAQGQREQMVSQMTSEFQQTFPDVKRMVNPLVQAKSELVKRQQAVQAREASVLTLVHLIQPTLVGLPPVEGFTWQGKKLVLSWSEGLTEAQKSRFQTVGLWRVNWLSDRRAEWQMEVSP